MMHFVCKPCHSTIDPVKTAADWFDMSQPHLIVIEQWTKAGRAPHWHFQGHLLPSMTKDKAQTEAIKQLNADHPVQEHAPPGKPFRPWGRRLKRCDDQGFAYMLKQDDCTIVKTLFDEEELEDYRERSAEYVKEKKAEMPTYVRENMKKRKRSCSEEHSEWRRLALEFYLQTPDKNPPPRNQANILWAMATTTGVSSAMKSYIAERI